MNLLGVPVGAVGPLLGLGAALLWGGGDFCGGMGVKRGGGSTRAALLVVLVSHASSFVMLLVIAGVLGDSFPHGAALAWGLGAGVAGGLSLTCFYMALARGAMGVSAAVSGLLAAAIPAVVSMSREGSPGLVRLAGFGVAGAAIWMIAADPVSAEAGAGAGRRGGTMALAVAAGVGFGIYFVALKFAGSAGLIWPMATARMGSLSLCSLVLLGVSFGGGRSGDGGGRSGGSWGERLRLPRTAVLWALGPALLDTSGNLLFIAATRAGRLDVAAVLASLYPASTILLAAWTLGEKPNARQGLGMAVAVAGVVLITL